MFTKESWRPRYLAKKNSRTEQTFILIKPEGIARNLIGQVLTRFERAGIKIIGMKMIPEPSKNLVGRHYPDSVEWLRVVGQKTLKTYSELGEGALAKLGTEDPVKIGRHVREWLIEYISAGPVLGIVLQGNHVVENAKRMVGPTIPLHADVGTIRGDFSIDSPDLANAMHRPVGNVVHVSGSIGEAKKEIRLWFRKEELFSDYETVSDGTLYQDWLSS